MEPRPGEWQAANLVFAAYGGGIMKHAFDDVQLGGDVRISQLLMETLALFQRHAGVLIAVHDEKRGIILGNLARTLGGFVGDSFSPIVPQHSLV